MNPKSYTPIAVDIAKETLEICEGGKKTRSLKYDKKGIQTLVKIAQKTRDPLVVFESTGGYERRLQDALHKASVPLCLVNAAWIRSFAQSEGVKAKTDPVDAQVIWRFAQEKQLEATPELSSERLALRDLLDRRIQLVESKRCTAHPIVKARWAW